MRKTETSTDLPYHGRDKGVAEARDNNKHLRALHRENGKTVLCRACEGNITLNEDTFMPSDGYEYCNGICYTNKLRKYF